MSVDLKSMNTPKWTFRLANSKSFEDIIEISNAKDRQLDLLLNRAGSLTFNLNIEDEQALRFFPIKTCVKAYRNGELVWSGPVWNISDSTGDGKTQISCVGWLELLNKRGIMSDLQYSNVDAGEIAFDLLNKSYLDKVTDVIKADDFIMYNTLNPGLSIQDEGNTGNLDITGSSYGGFINSDYLHNYANITVPNANLFDFTYENCAFTTQYFLKSGFKYQINIDFEFQFTVDNTGAAPKYFSLSTPGMYGATYYLAFLNPEFKNLKIETNSWDKYKTSIRLEFEYDGSSALYNSIILQPRMIYANEATSSGSVVLRAQIIEYKKVYDIPILPGTSEPTQNRTRSYQKFSLVGQEITSLSEVEAGYDLSIHPESRELNIYSYIGKETSHSFGYGVGANNLKNMSVNYDSSRMVNKFVAMGQSNYFVANDYDKQDEYGIFFEAGSASSVSDRNILGAYANAEVALRNNPVVTYDFQPMPTGPVNVPQPFDDYNVGDTVFVSARKGRVDMHNQKTRIFGMTIDISNEGQETVTAIKTQAS